MKNSKGITMVSLVITIVVILILSTVSVRMVFGQNGLLWKAKNNQDTNANVIAKEEGASNELSNEYGEVKEEKEENQKNKISNAVSDGRVKIGDYIKYTPSTPDSTKVSTMMSNLQTYSGSAENTTTLAQESLNWRVLDIKDGQVRLISDIPTTAKVSLKGYNGYNNAVYLLNEACETLYSGENGTAQSLNIEDIEEHLAYDYTEYENENVDTGKYGGTVEYTTKMYYPTMFAMEKSGSVDGVSGTKYGLNEQTQLINQTSANIATSKIKITQTYWYKTMQESDFKTTNGTAYLQLFIQNSSGNNYNSYWVASRCIESMESYASYRVRAVRNGFVDAVGIYSSDTGAAGIVYGLRPVITLDRNVTLDITDITKDGSTAEKAWKLQ